MPDDTGTRVAELRKAAGLTQEQLAQRANVSKSLLFKVEIGDKPASHALVTAVARALRVPVERVHGQPYATDGVATEVVIDQLRSAVRAYDLTPDASVEIRPLRRLRADVASISELRRAGRYSQLGGRLPHLLAELGAAAHTSNDSDRRAVFGLLVSAYYAAHGLAYRLGFADLSESIEHTMRWAADHAEDPLAVGLADWTRVNSFQAAGDYDHGLQILDRARATLTRAADTSTAAAVTILGSMHLRAVTLASRAGDTHTARDHLRQAYQLADGLGAADHTRYHLTFGPSNARIHDVAAHVELGRPDQAIHLGETFTPPDRFPPTRAGHHHLDLARAHLMVGDRAKTLEALNRARQIAPEQTRYHPMVREAARVLISLHRRANPDLTQLATWLGLTT